MIPDKSRSTMKPDYKLVAKAKYIHTTADLASEIWHLLTETLRNSAKISWQIIKDKDILFVLC